MAISWSIRGYFSTNFLWTALHTGRRVGELETAAGDRPRFDMAHRSYAVSSVIASAAFLEATVSELFQDAHDGHGVADDGYLAPLDPAQVAAMAETWRETDEGWSLRPVEKWQRLRECCGHDPLDPGAGAVQDADLLIRLRNALVHFKPETVGSGKEHSLERSLRPKFTTNRLWEGNDPDPWWPNHALGHACTEWAARSARALADHVLDDLDITANYRRIEAAGWNGREP